MRAISPVLSVLMMIAIAVAASLVAYAWIMGYIGGTTQKVGKAVQVQGLATDNGNLVVYVQNVGQGTVEFKPEGSIYVNDALKNILSIDNNPLEQGKTATIMADYPVTAGEPLKVKVVTADGTFMETTNPQGAAIPTSVTLTLNPTVGGSITKNPDQLSYAYGTTVELTATANLGYTFNGWNGDPADTTNPDTITMNGNKVVTATFTLNVYTLAVTTVGSGSVSKNPDQSTYHHGDSIQLTATPAIGWTFSAWSGDITGSTSPQTITMDENKEVTATFTQVFDHFTITAPASATAGQSFGNVIVTAYDSANSVVTGYTGQVYFTSTDGAAVLPYTSGSRYPFVSGDNGVHTFSGFTLKTAGSRTITVTDGTKSATSSAINVSPGALNSFAFNTISSPQTVDTGFSITITAKDAYGNTVTSYTGTNTLSASTGAGTINPTSTGAFSNGVRTLSVTLYQSGSGVTISTTGSSKSGTSNTFTVNPTQVTYLSAGTGSGTTGNPTPTYPGGLRVNDLILLQVTVRDTSTTPTTPAGFTALYNADSTGIGRQWIYYKFSTGSETGSLTITIGGLNCKTARMYAFRNVALSSFNEGGSFGYATSTTISARSVTTLGEKRLAVSFVLVNDDVAVAEFTGESNGNWIEPVAEFTTDQGSDGCIQLQTATIPSATTISGGTRTIPSAAWGVRAFALKPR